MEIIISLYNVSSTGNQTTMGGGMDMTMAPTAPFTSRQGGVDRTMIGGGMDMTLGPTITTNRTMMEGSMDMTMARTTATDKTMMGGGMDMTLAPTTTCKDRTMIGGGMDMTLAQELDLETTGDNLEIRSSSFVCLASLCVFHPTCLTPPPSLRPD